MAGSPGCCYNPESPWNPQAAPAPSVAALPHHTSPCPARTAHFYSCLPLSPGKLIPEQPPQLLLHRGESQICCSPGSTRRMMVTSRALLCCQITHCTPEKQRDPTLSHSQLRLSLHRSQGLSQGSFGEAHATLHAQAQPTHSPSLWLWPPTVPARHVALGMDVTAWHAR